MATRLPFAQIDAFATRAFEGNPAAVVALDDWLPDAVLQEIAAENNLSETAFIVPRSDGIADFDLRWFTPTVEVALCGHATLAAGHFVLSKAPMQAGVRFATRRSGILGVDRAGSGYALDLPATPMAADHGSEALAAHLGAPGAAMFRSRTDAKDVVIALLSDAAAVRALAPDFPRLREEPALVIATAPGDGGFEIVSRVFAAAYGIDEDPVTGAAHAALVPFWSARLGRDRFRAYQASRRGGVLDCRMDGERVILGGGCVTVIEGTFEF